MGCTCEKVQKKNSKIGQSPKNDLAASPSALTDTQKAVIKNNWQILKVHIANVGVITFVSMFESKPDLKEAFSTFRGKELSELYNSGLIRAHALRVMATVDKCVTRIDTPSSMIKLCRELGQHHKKYNIHPDYMEEMLMPFLAAIKPHLEDCWSPDTETTWRTLMATILFYIREGMLAPSPDEKSTERSSTRGSIFSNKRNSVPNSPSLNGDSGTGKNGKTGEQKG